MNTQLFNQRLKNHLKSHLRSDWVILKFYLHLALLKTYQFQYWASWFWNLHFNHPCMKLLNPFWIDLTPIHCQFVLPLISIFLCWTRSYVSPNRIQISTYWTSAHADQQRLMKRLQLSHCTGIDAIIHSERSTYISSEITLDHCLNASLVVAISPGFCICQWCFHWNLWISLAHLSHQPLNKPLNHQRKALVVENSWKLDTGNQRHPSGNNAQFRLSVSI